MEFSLQEVVLQSCHTDSISNRRSVYDDYQLSKKLGEGGFSVVFEGVSKTDMNGTTYAIKIVEKSKLRDVPSDGITVTNEIKILQSISHPNVVKIFDTYEDHEHIYLILEEIHGGELFDHIEKKSNYCERDARDFLFTIMSTVDYLHNMHIVHRDLKSENLLLTSAHDNAGIKLIDFGFATYATSETLTDSLGSPNFAAPEIIRSDPHGKPVDIWAIGVIAFILLTGYYPFDDLCPLKLMRQIINGKVVFPDEFWATISDDAKDFISRCLTINSVLRLTASEALRHPWLSDIHDSSLEENKLLQTAQRFRSLNMRRKLKASITTVVAVNRFISLLASCDK